MFEHWLNILAPALANLGPIAYLVVFLIFFLEAVVGIGLIIPGAIVAILLGTLISRGGFNFQSLMIAGSLGFLAGDILSFYLGSKGTSFFTSDAKLLKLSLLEKGKGFFERHGSKSVFLGRFIGFVRPLTPFIAGLSKMSWTRFLILDLASIIIWLYLHLLAGFFFGQALWLVRLWSGRLETMLIYLVIVFSVLWLSKRLIIKNGRILGVILRSVWHSTLAAIKRNPTLTKFYQKHQTFFKIFENRFDKSFWGWQFSLLSLLWCYTVLNFIWLVNNLFLDNAITEMDMRIENLMRTFKNFFFMKFFVGVTVLGSWPMILLFGLTVSLWFYYQGRQKLIWPLCLSSLGANLTTTFIKEFIDRPRPTGSLYLETSSSFPSLHATLAMSFFGLIFFLYYKKQHSHKKKVNSLFIFSLLIALIGLSRLYLRVHYLSDVIAGYLIGFAWLLGAIGFILYYKLDHGAHAPQKKPRIRLAIIITLILEISAYAGLVGYYRSQLNLKQLEPTSEIISTNIVQDFKDYNLDQYSESFDGAEQEPISLIITASSTDLLIKDFGALGYTLADKPNFKALLTLFKKGLLNEPYANLPIAPSFWETRVDDLSFTKQVGNERHYAIFWDSHFNTPNGKSIYLGLTGAKRPTRLIIKKRMNPNIDGEREAIFEELKTKKLIASWSRHQFIEPLVVKKLLNEYFTDGKLYIIDLK
jgi:undecaprenyl-diphosphatase